MRERILVLLANLVNERLLGEALATRYDVVHDVAAGGIDLCIVDGVVLHREWARIAELRRREEPLLLPVLLATDRIDVGLLTRDLWQVVDDVIMRPIEKAELRARLETLLRARRLSLELRDMSNLYEHERRIARRLQEAALPRAFPRIPGVSFDVFYRAGSDEALVGGDWYDVMRLADGRLVFSVGDVSGAGLDAAVTMSNLRQTLRGVAQVHADPGLMLHAADAALALEPDDRQATAFVGVFDPVTRFLSYATAGHPPAVLRCADGALLYLSTAALPLGVDQSLTRAAESIELPLGAMLVAHTDGLTEASRDVISGEARLAAVVGDPSFVHAKDPALEVQRRALLADPHDDVVILVLRVTEENAAAELHRFRFDAFDAHSARAARAGIMDVLREQRFAERALLNVELVYGELLANAVRHAPGELEVVLDTSGPDPVLHVLDRGPGFRMTPRLPRDDLSEHGRGLYIINELVDLFHVVRRTGHGSHATAVLRR